MKFDVLVMVDILSRNTRTDRVEQDIVSHPLLCTAQINHNTYIRNALINAIPHKKTGTA